MRNLITTIGAITAVALMPAFAADGDGATKPKAPVKSVDGGAVEKKMLDYWAPDPEVMIAQFKKQIGDDPSAAAMLPIITAMLQNMAVEVKKGEVIIHAMGEKQVSTYTITKVDAATNVLTMQVNDQDVVGEGKAKIDGDKLTLSKDGEDIVLNRIKKDEFEKRKKAAAQPPVIPGLE